MSTVNLLKEFVSETLAEAAPVELRVPKTYSQKKAMKDLVRWVGDKMKAPEDTVSTALTNADKENWDDALELLRDFYVMKGIKFKTI